MFLNMSSYKDLCLDTKNNYQKHKIGGSSSKITDLSSEVIWKKKELFDKCRKGDTTYIRN